jgi:hypothetical protein
MKFLRDTAKYVVLFNMKPSVNDPNVFVGSFTLDEVRASQAAATIAAPWISNMVMANLDSRPPPGCTFPADDYNSQPQPTMPCKTHYRQESNVFCYKG